MSRIGQLIFIGVVLVALALYWVTMPNGLPWNDSTHLALAYLGEVMRLPAMPHPIWGFYVKVFGGSVGLSVTMAALAAGLLSVVVNRYFGWRLAAAVSLVWIFMPGVWDRAVTGERGICLVSMCVVAVWGLDVVVQIVMKRVRLRKHAETAVQGLGELSATHSVKEKRRRINVIASWSLLGLAILFAIVSASMHDYQLGEAASAYARGMVEVAGDRIIVLNGACDDQMIRERKGKEVIMASRNDDGYRTKLLAWVKERWPEASNLRIAAQVGPMALVDAIVDQHSDQVFLMNGAYGTKESWERRWGDFAPYLKSRDKFVSVARRLFGIEGNSVANKLLDVAGGPDKNTQKAAWDLYQRIYEEVAPGNISALLNMSEMIRLGYKISGDEQKKVQMRLETFFTDANNRKHAKELIHSAGPVRVDAKQIAKLEAEAKKRIAERVAAGEKLELKPEVLSLIEWNNEMVTLMDRGELEKAGRIARQILSDERWRGFIPANAVMGAVASQEGDYEASEVFFKVATSTTNKVAVAVLNDYADTLMMLGKLDEAEKMARRAVAESDEKFWIAHLTLAQVLNRKLDKMSRKEDVEKAQAEIEELIKFVEHKIPKKNRKEFRKTWREHDYGK